jgi:hypothetical protein
MRDPRDSRRTGSGEHPVDVMIGVLLLHFFTELVGSLGRIAMDNHSVGKTIGVL